MELRLGERGQALRGGFGIQTHARAVLVVIGRQ